MIKFILPFVFLVSVVGRTQSTVSAEELEILIGEWTGTLTYVDYSSNEPYSMPADLEVSKGKNPNQLQLYYKYPNEPKANSNGKIAISKKGEALNGDPLISKEKLPNGDLVITTESPGKDNNQNALIRQIYVVGENGFTIRKEVKFENTKNWMQRNEFNFKRNP